MGTLCGRREHRINVEWETPVGSSFIWEHAAIEVLMDIRAELRKLNALMHCPNTQAIPRTLARIDRKLTKPKGKTK